MPKIIIASLLALVGCFVLNISLGSVAISLPELWQSLIGNSTETTTDFILWQHRFPKAFTALFCGAGLALSGLLMQVLFRNPLAGPFVLGISSGSGLGVALLIMGGSLLGLQLAASASGVIIAAIIGSLLVLLGILSISFLVKDTLSLLIVGLMFGSLAGAIIGILSYFTASEKLQQFVFWSLGNLSGLTTYEIIILATLVLLSFILLWIKSQGLNVLLLGENYAKSLGVDFKQVKWTIIVITALLTGSITALVGPIAFVGLAVPHISRLFVASQNHRLLVPLVVLHGAILMLLCDIIAQSPWTNLVFPINAITSIIGAPLVIWLLLRRKKLIF